MLHSNDEEKLSKEKRSESVRHKQYQLFNACEAKKGITVVIITNRRVSEIKSLQIVLEIADKIVIVTNQQEELLKYNKIRIIYSRSQNYAYLRNLGAYYAETTHVFVIDSDEEMDELLIDSLKKINCKEILYCINIKAFIGSKEIHMTERYNPRVYNKNYFYYRGRVHEALYGEFERCIRLNGNISNFSQDNWKEWSKKAMRYVSQERIEGRLLLRMFRPFFSFFKKQGWKDGVTGVKWTLKGFQYMLMIFIFGKRGYFTLDPEKIKCLLSTTLITREEKNYISMILVNHFENHEIISTQNHAELKLKLKIDILEQISSPFIKYY